METLEQIKAELTANTDKKLQEASIEIAVRERLTIQPSLVHVHTLYTSPGSLNYRATSREEAFNIVKTFAINPAFVCKGKSSTAVKPFDDGSGTVTEMLAWFVVDTFNVKLCFYTFDNWKVNIEMPTHLFGYFRKDRPNARTNYKMQWQPNSLFCENHKLVQYAAGSYYGPHSYGGSIWAMYEAYEIERQLTTEK